jgi:ABC-2 type transport system permease protein
MAPGGRKERVRSDVFPRMNADNYTFVLDIPAHFERDVLSGRASTIQLNVDATAMVQAGLGAGYVQQIINTEIDNFLSRAEGGPQAPVDLAVRIAFNPNVETAWFTSVMGIINSITMLAIVLAGAAVVALIGGLFLGLSLLRFRSVTAATM